MDAGNLEHVRFMARQGAAFGGQGSTFQVGGRTFLPFFLTPQLASPSRV
jgi:hypothetical protein